MLRRVFKVAMFLATSAVAVPYTLAFLANMLYGWPQEKGKYRRAFHPRKVYALTYTLLQQTTNLKFVGLYFKLRDFYNKASEFRLIKNISYGSNENCLDLYFPDPRHADVEPEARRSDDKGKPIIVFVYGGAWGSGDKSMYGLLCCQLADKLQAVVVCPNYSIYPKGYVDDMVQDLVDCLTWLHLNAETYGADKNRILLVGHSAGAHLCFMATLELTLKRLLHNPEAVILPEDQAPPSVVTSGLTFEEGHFSRNNGSEGMQATWKSGLDSSLTSGSFYMVDNGNNGENGKSSEASETFIVVDKNNGDQPTDSNGENNLSKSMEIVAGAESTTPGNKEQEEEDEEKEVSVEKERTERVEKSETEGKEKDVNVTQLKKVLAGSEESELQKQKSEPLELVIEDDDEMTKAQREVRDLLTSIRCVIGLAGVYDIEDHFLHEYSRGVEDVSHMAKAMYGREHFSRFSPSQIVRNLPPRTRLPPVVLLHGSADYVVPESSTDKFSDALEEMGGTSVIYVKVPGCQHVDLCLDMMDSSRPYYIIMEVIKKEAQLHL